MATKKLMTVDEVQGAWAIMPTPAKDNASDWRVTDTVDYDEAARAVEGLVDAGIDGILSLGTLGECATLTWEEKKKFIATAVEATRGRIPFFAGTTCLGTRETIQQTREAYKLGARGTMLGLPMWCAADLTNAVRFYKDVAEACPEMAICVYANTAAFRFTFPTEFWAQVSEIPQVITAKYGAVPNLEADVAASKKRIRFMPIEFQYCSIAQSDPEFNTAFWTSGAVCGPNLAVHLRDVVVRAKATKKWDEAEELTQHIGMSVMSLIPKGNFEEFNKYNIGLEKARMDAGGWMKAGPCRPPYVYVPEEYLQGARASGTAWAELARKVKASK
jgi:trans-o-hydroxybenzylidenepyruvate hydratase-aldolase